VLKKEIEKNENTRQINEKRKFKKGGKTIKIQ
jgi:hypothetical protein